MSDCSCFSFFIFLWGKIPIALYTSIANISIGEYNCIHNPKKKLKEMIMMQKITQTNINQVDKVLRRICTSNGRDFSQHLGFTGDHSYSFDVCNKKGKVICLAFFADEIIEVLNSNGFEVNSLVTPLPGEHCNHVCFLFRAA